MATETLRPNAAGDTEALDIVAGDGVGTHYTTVDEVSSDGDTSYVATSSSAALTDTHNLQNHSASGTINSVKVYGMARATVTPDRASCYVGIKTGGTIYATTNFTVTTSYALYSPTAWTLNPFTGVAWTLGDIDALQSLISMRDPIIAGSTYETRCTQVYVVVDYTVAVAKPRSFSYIIG